MAMHVVTLQLPGPLLQAAEALARDRDCSLWAVIRAALNAEIRRANLPVKTPNRADERLVDPLRALLAADFGEARSWPDLQARLAAKGYALREAGGGMALHSHPEGSRLLTRVLPCVCNALAVGATGINGLYIRGVQLPKRIEKTGA